MKRCLITGAQGFLGRHLVSRLLDAAPGAQILGLGRSLQSAQGRWEEGRARYRQIDLLDTEALTREIRAFAPDCIFHLAAAHGTATERELFATNLEGTSSLLRAAEALPEAVIVLGSSGGVYGAPLALPIAESQPCNPIDLYGVSKLAAEHLARVKAGQSGAFVIAARIFNVVGPGQPQSHVCGRLAAQLARLARAGGGTLEVGALEPTRDFLDVRDVASALLLLAERGDRGGIYNVASGREVSIEHALGELLRISGLSGEVRLVRQAGRPAGVLRHVADVTRLARLGFSPAISFERSLLDLYRSCQEDGEAGGGDDLVSGKETQAPAR